MSRSLMVFMLAAAAAFAQSQPKGELNSAGTAGEAVITLNGLCDHNPGGKSQTGTGAACSEVVTGQQFETMMTVLRATSRGPVSAPRREIAKGYADLMIYANAAMKSGVDKDPRFAEVMEFVRLRALSDMYKIRLEERANQISPEEIQNYYQKHIAEFEELSLRHVTLPANNSAKLSKREFQTDEAKRIAEEMRGRAARGEDMEKLQKEAFDRLGIAAPPPTLMVPIRRGAFDPRQEQQIFALQPGGVTPVIEQASVLLFFKLESRKTLSLEEVKPEIAPVLSREKMERLTKELSDPLRIEYNDRYFGVAPVSATSPGAAPSK